MAQLRAGSGKVKGSSGGGEDTSSSQFKQYIIIYHLLQYTIDLQLLSYLALLGIWCELLATGGTQIFSVKFTPSHSGVNITPIRRSDPH